MVIKNEDGHDLEDSGPLFAELSTKIPSDNYYQFLNKLDGIAHNQAKTALTTKINDFSSCVLDFLVKWENKGRASKNGLKTALHNAGIGGHCHIVDEYFTQGTSGRSDGTGRNNQLTEITETGTRNRHVGSSADGPDAHGTTPSPSPTPATPNSEATKKGESRCTPFTGVVFVVLVMMLFALFLYVDLQIIGTSDIWTCMEHIMVASAVCGVLGYVWKAIKSFFNQHN